MPRRGLSASGARFFTGFPAARTSTSISIRGGRHSTRCILASSGEETRNREAEHLPSSGREVVARIHQARDVTLSELQRSQARVLYHPDDRKLVLGVRRRRLRERGTTAKQRCENHQETTHPMAKRTAPGRSVDFGPRDARPTAEAFTIGAHPFRRHRPIS